MSEVTARVWNGSVHIHILYKNSEYLLDAKRVSYFPVYFQQIADFFFAATGVHNLLTNPVWLEFEHVPLKWNLPIGLLHDLLYLSGGSSCTYKPVWTLTLRVASEETPYPSESIIPFGKNCFGKNIDFGKNSLDLRGNSHIYTNALDRVLINSLKQSCYVVNGNSRAVLGLSEDDTRALWHSMATHDFTVYSSISKKLVAAAKSGKPVNPLNPPRQRVPLKMYFAGSDVLLQAPVWTKDDVGNDNTLSSAIKGQLAGAGVSLGGKNALPLVYIHGINVDVLLEEPVFELWARLRYMDNFLYVVLVMRG